MIEKKINNKGNNNKNVNSNNKNEEKNQEQSSKDEMGPGEEEGRGWGYSRIIGRRGGGILHPQSKARSRSSWSRIPRTDSKRAYGSDVVK